MKQGDIVCWQYKFWKQHLDAPYEYATLFSTKHPELAFLIHRIESTVCYWRIKKINQR